jgi:hypothetical protein
MFGYNSDIYIIYYKWMAWSWVLVWRRRDHLSGGWDASDLDRCADGVTAGFGHGPSVITSDIYCNQMEEKPLKSPLINSVITSNQVEENPLTSHLSDPSRHHDRIPQITGTHRWPGSPGDSPPCWGAVEFGGRPGITAFPGWSLGELMPRVGGILMGFCWDILLW